MFLSFEEAKLANPKMRRRNPVGIIHSGCSKTVLQCCLCGAKHSCATSYRQAVHVAKFSAYHNAGKCVAHLIEQVEALVYATECDWLPDAATPELMQQVS